jgi:hypothetical protein
VRLWRIVPDLKRVWSRLRVTLVLGPRVAAYVPRPPVWNSRRRRPRAAGECVSTEGAQNAAGPFHVVFGEADARDRRGFACGNRGSLGTAMGRIQCTDRGNLRKPDEWDAARE